jgi:lysozyme
VQRSTVLFLLLAGSAVLFALSRTRKGADVVASATEGVAEVLDRTRALIASIEGLRLDAYQDSGGAWTIGYGHLIRKDEQFYPYGDIREITLDEAGALFDADIAAARATVADSVAVPLTDGQRAALESFVFNIGRTAFQNSTMLRKLNIPDFGSAADEFGRWIYDNGKQVPGLVTRRAREREVFES